jgi:hypothetical protein
VQGLKTKTTQLPQKLAVDETIGGQTLGHVHDVTDHIAGKGRDDMQMSTGECAPGRHGGVENTDDEAGWEHQNLIITPQFV